MFKLALILAILPAVILGDHISFEACKYTFIPGSLVFEILHSCLLPGKAGGPQPNWIDIPGCDMSGCNIYNGLAVDLTGEFTSSYDATELTTTLKAYISIIGLDLALPDEIADGCQSVEGGCPVAAGETRSIKASFTVDTTFKDISPAIELKIVNENADVVMCVRTTVNLFDLEE